MWFQSDCLQIKATASSRLFETHIANTGLSQCCVASLFRLLYIGGLCCFEWWSSSSTILHRTVKQQCQAPPPDSSSLPLKIPTWGVTLSQHGGCCLLSRCQHLPWNPRHCHLCWDSWVRWKSESGLRYWTIWLQIEAESEKALLQIWELSIYIELRRSDCYSVEEWEFFRQMINANRTLEVQCFL